MNSLGNNIPRTNIVQETLLDGNSNSNVGGNLTATSVTWGTDGQRGYQKGYAILNGTTAFISGTTTYTNNQDITTSCWIKITSNPSGNSKILMLTSSQQVICGIYYYTSGGNFFIALANTLDNAFTAEYQVNLLNIGWHHLVTTKSGTTQTIYLDGVAVGSTGNSGTGTSTFTANQTMIGKNHNSSANFWNGQIEGLRIYSSAISLQEIQLLYFEGLRKLGPSNIASYPALFNGLVYYADFKGTAHNLVDGVAGTVTGATLTTDRFGYANSAYSFDGSGDKIDLTTSATFRPTNNITFSQWVNYTANASVMKSFQASNRGYGFFTNNSGSTINCFGYYDTTNFTSVSTATINDGNWHQITGVIGGGNLAFYIDGVLISSVAFGGGSINYTADTTLIGQAGAGGQDFNGKIDDTILITRALSADEVKMLYILSQKDNIFPTKSYDLPNLRDGLVLDLNEQGKDLSGQGNNGTLVASPTVIRQGKAKGLTYNGTTQYIDFNNILDETGTSPFSLSVWLKYSATTNQMIFGKQLSSGNFTGYMIWHRGTPNFKLEFTAVSTPTNIIEVLFPSGYTDGKWHHIVCTYDGSKTASGCKGYVDGVAVTLTTLVNSLTGSISTTASLNIGARNDGNLPTTGSIVNPRKYSRVLTPKEIESLYYSQKGNFIY